MKKEEQGQPKGDDRERVSSSVNGLVTLSTKFAIFVAVIWWGGTQKEEPGAKGSQSGVELWTMILRTNSFSFLRIAASASVLEVAESRSISMSCGFDEKRRLKQTMFGGADVIAGSLNRRRKNLPWGIRVFDSNRDIFGGEGKERWAEFFRFINDGWVRRFLSRVWN